MRRTTIRVPAKPYIPVPWHIRVFKALCYISAAIMLYAMILIVVFEFMVGCGEKTYHADGTYQTNSCMFIPYTPVKGAWK